MGRARPTSAWKPRSSRRQHWLTLPEGLATPGSELWDPVRPLYETGEYAEAAARGRELLGTHPDLGLLFYNTACCESLAREVEGAVSHLLGRVRGPRAGGLRLRPDPRRRCVRRPARLGRTPLEAYVPRAGGLLSASASTPRPRGGRGGRRRRKGSGTRGRTRRESSGSTRTSSGLMRGRSSTQAPTPLAAGVMPPLSTGGRHRATPRPRDRPDDPEGAQNLPAHRIPPRTCSTNTRLS